MYNLVPFLLIIISLAVILIIIGRKFSVLAALDVDSIPEVKENKFKEQIISSRLKRNFLKWTARSQKISRKAWQILKNFFSNLYNRLLAAKEEYRAELKSTAKAPAGPEAVILKLLSEAEKLKKEENYSAAEEKLIEIIKLDSQNLAAFKLLGEVYFANRQFTEARETFAHILRLQAIAEEEGAFQKEESENFLNLAAPIYYNLALTEKALANWQSAGEHLSQALRLEPNNPRYLDTMIEISILNNDKFKAEKALGRLKKVNPENQKLAKLEEKIKKLP